MAICKLCLKDKKLLKKSHIIPDFMYKDLYDKDHKMRMFSPLERVKGEDFVRKPSSGEYEGGILCHDCDNVLLNKFENYTKKALYGGSLKESICPVCKNFYDDQGNEFTICNNIDYKLFKLFLLSILWRASISSRDFFKDINLKQNEETIRNMLINDDPGPSHLFPVAFHTFVNDKKMPIDIIAQPRYLKNSEGIETFIFVINGMLFRFYINHPTVKIPKVIIENTINEENKMTIMHIEKGKGMDFLMKFTGL